MSSPKHSHTGHQDRTGADYPKIPEKDEFPQSNISTLRYREPTNPQTASKGQHMVFDHRNQMPIVPNRVATGANSAPATTNRSGKPFALNTFVGGSPDPQGEPLVKQTGIVMTE